MFAANQAKDAPTAKSPPAPSALSMRARRVGFEGLTLRCKTEGDLPVLVAKCGFEDKIAEWKLGEVEKKKLGRRNLVRGAGGVMTAPALPVWNPDDEDGRSESSDSDSVSCASEVSQGEKQSCGRATDPPKASMLAANEAMDAPTADCLPAPSALSMRARRAGFEGLALRYKTEGDLPVLAAGCGFEDQIAALGSPFEWALGDAERKKLGRGNSVRGAGGLMTAPDLLVWIPDDKDGRSDSMSSDSDSMSSASEVSQGEEQSCGGATDPPKSPMVLEAPQPAACGAN